MSTWVTKKTRFGASWRRKQFVFELSLVLHFFQIICFTYSLNAREKGNE